MSPYGTDELHRRPIWAAPDEVPFAWTLPHANAQLDLVVGLGAYQPAEGTQVFKGSAIKV